MRSTEIVASVVYGVSFLCTPYVSNLIRGLAICICWSSACSEWPMAASEQYLTSWARMLGVIDRLPVSSLGKSIGKYPYTDPSRYTVPTSWRWSWTTRIGKNIGLCLLLAALPVDEWSSIKGKLRRRSGFTHWLVLCRGRREDVPPAAQTPPMPHAQ